MALLALSCRSVAGGSTVTITSHPFVICRPLRLVVDPLLAPRFDLLGIRIGVMSQNAGEGWISCSCFPPHPEGGDPVDNLAGLPIVMPGQAFAIEVQNKTAFASDFSAYLRVGLVA